MKAVADSSVLIALSTIEKLTLLRQRFPEGIIIPQAVWHEVVETGKGMPGADGVAAVSWITVSEVKDSRLLSLLQAELDEGEAEAIALCVSLLPNLREQLDILQQKGAFRLSRSVYEEALQSVGETAL